MGFGNVPITFTKNEFSDFNTLIGNIYNRPHARRDISVKHIMIPAPRAGLTLLLNPKEPSNLFTKLDAADNEIQAQQLLQLSYNEEE